ncbi:MAG: hypothetical protein HHJ09_14370 [Glaciimonas sp.]|nr:hypothetical protein [Glaciimonas sp.]
MLSELSPQTLSITLPSTSALLVSGGDTRIVLDPVSGLSMYGCRPYPDPDLVALGSSTASVISEAGIAASSALRQTCLDQLQHQSPISVYATHVERLRSELLLLCGFSRADGVNVVLAASGTDLHLLTAQWLRPQRTVMIMPTETGSGLPAAVQGQHFNRRSACGGAVPIGTLVSDWQGDLFTLSARAADGTLHDCARVDAECIARVTEAAEAGQQVLLILTDVSKTGLMVPSIETVLALKRRWQTQVEVLVDACQFRLSAKTIRAYISQNWMVALTGSKFIAGPTFSGALIIPPATATRYRDSALHPGARAYSSAADWPLGWLAGRSLLANPNFGLLLRWEAAITELRSFCAVPEPCITAFLRRFAKAVHERLARDACFEALPVPVLCRRALCNEEEQQRWDTEQTIFSFLLHVPDGRAGRRLLSRAETERLHQVLRIPGADSGTRRFQLGQPVPCGNREGVPISALRLCVSAPMIVAACADAGADATIADAISALDKISHILLAI